MTNVPFLRFAVLGPVRVRRDGETADLPLGGPQQRALLAVLLLNADRAVPVDVLVAALWGDEPPARAVGTLRTYVSRLRRVLEIDRTRPTVLCSAGDGYLLRTDTATLDLADFDRRVAEARSAPAPETARLLLASALNGWSGEPLAGLPGPFAENERARLEESRLAALQARLELDLTLGRHAEAVAELTALTTRHPLREPLHALLMLALYRSGRQAEALEAYAEIRRLLRSELGVDPGTALRTLHTQILKADPALLPTSGSAPESDSVSGDGNGSTTDDSASGPSTSVGEGTAGITRPASLPADLSDFTGRGGIVARVEGMLAVGHPTAPTVVAVSGVGGVGKTALAVHVAHLVRGSFPDGQLYVDLHGAGEQPLAAAVVLGEFLRALGVPDTAVPESEAEQAALYRTRLAGRRVLVLLDNARDAEQVRPLLPGDPGCAVLVTSRARLSGVAGARMVALEAFDREEALALFGRVVGAERVEAEAPAAARIIELCGRLPLAVRIVAARLAARPGWTVAAVGRRLDDARRRLAELRVGDLAVEATFRLGYDQLDEAQRRAFRTAALPETETVTPNSAAALLGCDLETAEDLLDGLVDLGLLDTPEPGRYRYHDLLALFARQTSERTDTAAERRAALTRLLNALLAAQRSVLALVRPGTPAATGEQPFPSADAARAWALGELGDLLALVRQAAADPAGPLTEAAELLLALDPVLEDGYRWAAAEPAARAVLDEARRRGDAHAEARARHALGRLHTHTSRLAGAREHAERALALSRATGDHPLLVAALDLMGHVAFYELDHAQAVAYLEEARALDPSDQVERTANIAYALAELGDAEGAARAADQARDLAHAAGHAAVEAYALYILGIALRDLGRLDEAVARFDDGLAICWSQGLRARESYLLLRISETQLLRGRPHEALASADKSLIIAREIAEEYQQARALVATGHAHAALNVPALARRHWREALTLFERLGVAEAEPVRALLAAATTSPAP